MGKKVENSIVGKKIVGTTILSNREMNDLGWFENTVVLVLEDGTRLFPSQDYEGNDSGVLFGTTRDGKEFTLLPKTGEQDNKPFHVCATCNKNWDMDAYLEATDKMDGPSLGSMIHSGKCPDCLDK